MHTATQTHFEEWSQVKNASQTNNEAVVTGTLAGCALINMQCTTKWKCTCGLRIATIIILYYYQMRQCSESQAALSAALSSLERVC